MDPSASADFGDLEGYIAARILTLALEKIQGSPTREAVVDALEGLGQFDHRPRGTALFKSDGTSGESSSLAYSFERGQFRAVSMVRHQSFLEG